MKVTILGPNLPREAKAHFEVHAAGCRHLTPVTVTGGFKRRGWKWVVVDGWTINVDSVLAVESNVYDWASAENPEYVLGDYLGEFHFSPCTANLPYSDPESDKLVEADEARAAAWKKETSA